MSKDIIEIDDYEVKDKQIVETTEEDDYQREYNNQREYDEERINGYYKSVSLSRTSILIVLMVIILLVVIFIMNFH